MVGFTTLATAPAVTLAIQTVAEPLSVTEDKSWKDPDESTIPSGKIGEEILYGKELIAHTAKYLDTKGSNRY